MRVLVIRHGIAEDREEAAKVGRADADRALTEEGRRRMASVAAGLRVVLPSVDRLATSPLVRAVETAEAVAAAYPDLVVERAECLAPGKGAEAVVAWLETCNQESTVAVVGHEPDLSELVTYLVSGTVASAVEMKKGAAALVEGTGGIQPGAGVLRWLLAPKQLRRLGGEDA